MSNKGMDFNFLIKELRQALKEKDIISVKRNALQAHEFVQDRSLTGSSINTFQNECLSGLNDRNFRYATSEKYQGYRTLAFFVFHMTRIEDICANVLIADESQVIFQNQWIKRMNLSRIDTGNSMSKKEMEIFSSQINQDALFEYRLAVAKKTRKIIECLTMEDLTRRPTKEQLNSLIETKSVLDHEDSIWLLDFWGKKNVGGLLLMPITRHQKVHLSDCSSIIKKQNNN